MKFNPARKGNDLHIKDRKVAFSFWPMGKGKRHEKLQSTLFVSDPWHIIQKQLHKIHEPEQKKLSDARKKQSAYFQSARELAKTDAEGASQLLLSKKLFNIFESERRAVASLQKAREVSKQAQQYLQQAKDFFKAAKNSDAQAAKPLLLYYSFLNLGKCFAVYKNRSLLPDKVYHGIFENFDKRQIKISEENNQTNAFKLFSTALIGEQENDRKAISEKEFLSQILVGHRLYCHAQGTDFTEKFISLEQMHIRQDKDASKIWLIARIARQDFARLSYPLKLFANSLTYRKNQWENVNEQNTEHDSDYIFAQSKSALAYKHKPSYRLNELCQTTSRRLWRIVTSIPPYRKYYIYIARDDEKVMHQLISIYLATYYFGSITRYKPSEFAALLNGEMGAFIHEFFESQPNQFLYLMASEFLEQEVAGAAIV